jgi:alkanesulfonate monooxygenase SsuD/methylene tetrahydromethanopterin reductase-like flavin-dependent oxidoreductase (luciferase family)
MPRCSEIAYADEIGFETIWTTEHHFVDDGYLVAVMLMMAAIGARTKRIKVGSFVLLGPFYHPLRLAEDAALIDVISGGRLRLGIGVAYRPEEFEIFHIRRTERLSRTLETIEILKLAWKGEPFSFGGKHFQFKNARVLSKPMSANGPELLWGGMNPKSIKRSAKLDLGFACNLGAEELAKYHDALRELGKDPANYSVINTRGVCVADSEDQAWNEIAPGLLYQMELYGKWLDRAASKVAITTARTPMLFERAQLSARQSASPSNCLK